MTHRNSRLFEKSAIERDGDKETLHDQVFENISGRSSLDQV